MRAIVQRVMSASVTINEEKYSSINEGFLVLLGITHADDTSDIDYLVKKISFLRIFDDEEGKMNQSINEIRGEVLVVSQFTLYANTQKGNRPSYMNAAPPDIALPIYKDFLARLEGAINSPIQSGQFGANMQIQLTNDGPVTIILDSNQKK